MSESRELLRHALATVAYRATRSLENAGEDFADFAGAGKRPIEILAHMGDLFDWALSMSVGEPHWQNSTPLAWEAEKARFYAALTLFDGFLASPAQLKAPVERLLQGPVADALTHVGQLAMLRRLAGNASLGENFYVAQIEKGAVSSRQAEPVMAFPTAS